MEIVDNARIASKPQSLLDKMAGWLPLPHMVSGYCIYPFHPHPSPPNSPAQNGEPGPSSARSRQRNRFSWSGLAPPGSAYGAAANGSGGFGDKANVYEVPLDVGDEFFAFEEFRCAGDEGGKGEVWYRGYVIQAVSLLSIAPMPKPQPLPPLTSTIAFPRPEPSVLVGIFPASVVKPRPLAIDDLGEPSEAYQTAVRMAEEKAQATAKGYEMDVVQEEDESELSPGNKSTVVSPTLTNGDLAQMEGVVDVQGTKRKSLGMAPAPNGSGPSRTGRPKSLLLLANGNGDTEEAGDKEQPPLPTLTAGDSTVSGQQWPLIDEIACAIREWYGRIPTYLANREYRLFNLVVQHIDALFLGRRQLLSQTLSADELIRVRRECVSRLVKCNVAQGLEVIVRSLEDGSVMVVDKARAIGESGYMNGITAYVYQVQLAYIDLIPLDTLFGRMPTPGTFRTDPRRSLQAVAKPHTILAGTFYHLLLDFRAFIASPCAPGETAELYFSLFSKTDNQFITEEYCLILNHLGSPARDAEQRLGRLRTLFTDLKGDEVNGHGQVYLVCRLIRNGAVNTRLEASSSGSRSTSDSIRRPSSLRPTGTYLSPHGHHTDTARSKASVSSVVTDDSWSITSGFAGHRTNTVETSATTTASIIDGRPSFRRPLGCAVLELPKLNKMLSDGGEKGGMEFSIPIFAPQSEEAFATLHEDIIYGRMKDVSTSPRAEAIAVGVRVLQGDVEQLVHEHPSILAESPISARLGFPDVVPPHQTRNDIYIKLWSATFFPSPSAGGGSIRLRKSIIPTNLGNVQITVELRTPDGTLIPGAMFAGGSGEPAVSHFHSMCFTQTDRPTYGELIKVALPPVIGDAHLFLSFRSRGKDKHLNSDPLELERPFAIAYLPLVGAGGAVKDGSHNLILYRSEKQLAPAPAVYLGSAPTSAPQPGWSDGSTRGSLTPLRDRLVVRTFLASTTHSSDDTLRALFDWRDLIGNPTALSSILNTFSFVSEDEISKFIPAVLDALFGILTSNPGSSDTRTERSEIDTLVFAAIVKILSMSTDRRFPNFTPTLDIYISQNFSRPASASQLLASMKSVMSTPNTKSYRSFLKVWHLFFRFIIRSRELDRGRGVGLDATSAHIEADFQRQVKSVLSDINALMRLTDQGIVGTQTLAVQHYADLLPSLAKIFAPVEIAQMIITFSDTLTAAKGSMAVYKLLLLLAVVKSVFDSAASRALLIPALVRWLKPHLGRYEEGYSNNGVEEEKGKDMKRIRWMECNRLAITVVAWTINCLQDWLDSEVMQDSEELRMQEQDNLEYLLTLLPSLCDSYAELRSSATTSTLKRQRTEGTIWKETPDIFPISHPFALVAQLPPPSLLEQNQKGDEAGLTEIGTFNCGLAECAVVILSLVLATPRQNVDRYLLEMLDIEGKERTSSTLKGVITFCSSVIHFDAFPRQWLSLTLMSFSAIIRLLYPIIDLLQRPEFIPPLNEAEGFDAALFTGCLELLCDLCGSDELALEDHTQQKRRAGWIIAGDLRDKGSGLLLSLWGALGWSEEGGSSGLRHGGYQTRFTGLAERILGLCLSSHDSLCETAVEILYSMIYAEYLLLGKFSNIETEIFAKLDGLFSQKSAGTSDPTDSTMRAYFITQLRTLYESKPSPDPKFAHQFSTFLDEVELFIDLLLTFRDLPESVEWKDERASAIYRLMDFIQRVGRSELYVRFVHLLVGINVGGQDWLGAGLAMKCHAETYEWTNEGDLVDRWSGEGVKLPAQTQFARRESLYYHAIDYFAEAEAYEFALDLCQELTNQHMALTYDINKITELLTHQARLWERMGHTTRPKPEYFRVAYYGESTPINQGKEFVIRGSPWQRYVDFCEAIQAKFPHSTIHRSKIAPTPEAIEAGDIIWVTSVIPEPDDGHPGLKAGVHPNIQAYNRSNGIRKFSSFRPFVKNLQDGSGSVNGHGHGQGQGILTWTEKTTLITADILPGLLSRSEVIDILYEEISPLSSAITEIKRGTGLLSGLVQFKPGQRLDFKQLGTALNGAVDSPINGGVKLYRDTFLDPGYIAAHPNDHAQLEEFRAAYEEYVRTVHGGLQLHGKVCKDIAFHEALKNHFYKAFPENRLPSFSESPHLGSLNGHLETPGNDIDATPKSRTSILKAFQPSPRPSLTSSSSRQSVSPSPASSLPTSTSQGLQQLFPPLRLGPSPTPITPVTALASPRPITDSSSFRSITTPPEGVPSVNLSTRAKSFAGSLGRSSSVSTASKRDSVRTENGRRGSGATENGNGTAEGEERSVLEVPVEKEKGVLKRLSSIMRRDSGA